MPASYPSSAKSFTTKNTNDTIQADHVNDLQLEVTAVENDLVGGLPVARGGTGITSFAVGDLLYASASGTLSKLADVGTGQVLVSGGVATAPAYSASPTVTALTATTLSGTTVTGATVTSTGQVVISGAGAGQIVFPAAQNASSNVNTLDDYEEGTWTPSIGGSGGQSGQVYTRQLGTYTKIGKRVFLDFNVLLSTLGTITTSVQIKDLPFTSQNTSNMNWTCSIGFFGALTSNAVFVSGTMSPAATVVTLFTAAAAATGLTAMVQADLSNTTQFIGHISYQADA